MDHKNEAMILESMEKDEKVLALEMRIKDFQERIKENEENLEKLSKLYELGIIDEDGELMRNNNS